MRYNRKNKRKIVRMKIGTSNRFTLIELITAMAVFSVIMLVLVRMLGAAQSAWLKSNERNMLYENGQIAMELMVRQLQNAQYGNGDYPFWHWKESGNDNNWAWGEDKMHGFHELICFVTSTSTNSSGKDVSNLAEVKYAVFWDKGSPRNTPSRQNINVGRDCWLHVSITSSETKTAQLISDSSEIKVIDPRYNFNKNFTVGAKTTSTSSPTYLDIKDRTASFTAISGDGTDSSSFGWKRYVPYVTELEFTCYDEDGNIIPPDNSDSSGLGTADACFTDPTKFPAIVKIKLSLLSKDAYNQWVELVGDGVTPYTEPTGNLSYKFRMKHQRTFTRFVIIRSRQNVN